MIKSSERGENTDDDYNSVRSLFNSYGSYIYSHSEMNNLCMRHVSLGLGLLVCNDSQSVETYVHPHDFACDNRT